jgi:hypothetical protein
MGRPSTAVVHLIPLNKTVPDIPALFQPSGLLETDGPAQ